MRSTGRSISRVDINKFLTSEGGLTLLEVLIALAILGLVGGIFASSLTMSSKLIMTTQEMVTVDSLARDQMEYSKQQEYLSEATSYEKIAIPTSLAGLGYDLVIVAEPLHSPDDGIQKVTVTVTRNGDNLYTLVDYKRQLGF